MKTERAATLRTPSRIWAQLSLDFALLFSYRSRRKSSYPIASVEISDNSILPITKAGSDGPEL